MRALYNSGIYLYGAAIAAASHFNHKAKLFKEGRGDIIGRIAAAVSESNNIIWFHSASVGEFEQARPIIEWLKENRPEYKILLTFFSPSGYELRKNYNKADWVFYLPLDTPGNAKAFLDAVKPVKAIFVKYEFWYNYLTELKKRGIETIIVCAIFRSSQNFFKWYGGFFRKMLYCFSHLFVQDKNSADLLASIGIRENVTINGDTRFDRVNAIARASKEIPLVEAFTKDCAFPVVAGSTWPPDEAHFAAVLQELKGAKLVLVPHEVEEPHIAEILKRFSSYKVERFTTINRDAESGKDVAARLKEADVLVIDTIGMLSAIYRYGVCSYIGGGFGVGIHNILEPAVYGIPVIFGPKFGKFKEARDLSALGGAFPIKDSAALKALLQRFFSDESALKAAGCISRQYVESNLGATEKITYTM